MTSSLERFRIRACRVWLSVAAGVAVILAMPFAAASRAGTPPTVEFITAPTPGASVPYVVPFSWQGTDVDGTVPLYRIAIDPPAFGEPYWIETDHTSQRYVFLTGILDLPLPASGPVTFSQPHTVVLKAVDNEGLESAPESRSFFSTTIAPEVQILSPTPSPSTAVPVESAVRIEWQGTDSDGFFNHRPVRYKFILLSESSFYPGGVAAAWANPNAFRDAYAPQFTDWPSCGGDTTFVQLTNLTLGVPYLFCVVGFDEAGAYSARFARGVNMIQFVVSTTPVEAETWGRLKRRFR